LAYARTPPIATFCAIAQNFLKINA